MRPPCRSTMLLHTARPKPTPELLVVKKGSKRSPLCSGNPGPLSRTDTRAKSSPRRRSFCNATSIWPFPTATACSAFNNRLSNTWRMRSASQETFTASSGGCQVTGTCACRLCKASSIRCTRSHSAFFKTGSRAYDKKSFTSRFKRITSSLI